jgi:hypothetical protein
MRYSRFKSQIEGKPATPRKPKPARAPREKSTKDKKSKNDPGLENEQKPTIKPEDGTGIGLPTPRSQSRVLEGSPVGEQRTAMEIDGTHEHAVMSRALGHPEENLLDGDGADIRIKSEPREEEAAQAATSSLNSQNDSQDSTQDAEYELDTTSTIPDLHPSHLHLDHSHTHSPMTQHSFSGPSQESMSMSFSSLPGSIMYSSPDMSASASFPGPHNHMMADMGHHNHVGMGMERHHYGSYMQPYQNVTGGYGGVIIGGNGMMAPNGQQQAPRGAVKLEERWENGFRM